MKQLLLLKNLKKTKYNNNTFLLLSLYTRLAQKFINKHAQTSTYDEELLCNITSAIIIADWQWNPYKKFSKKAYRKICACWTLKEYFSPYKFKHKHKTEPVELYDECDMIVETEFDNSHYLTFSVLDSLENLQNKNILTTTQVSLIRTYLNNKVKLTDIAKDLNITKTGAKHKIKTILKIIKDNIDV